MTCFVKTAENAAFTLVRASALRLAWFMHCLLSQKEISFSRGN